MTRPRILIADDDPAFRIAMTKALSRLGFPVEEAASGAQAVSAISSGRPDVALLDLQLGDLDGLTVLRRTRGARTRVIVVTGHGTIPAAVEAVRLGASSFIQKPVDAPSVLPLVEDAARELQWVAGLSGAGGAEDDLGLAGTSPQTARVRDFIRRAGPTDETVLVAGETGVGKEVVARALHDQSLRSRGPFVAFNCAQAHAELVDAELFGYVKGAFTGATQDRRGLFREAEGGTLFLDEVGELPEALQARFLRVLETRSIRPVGGVREDPVDVRIVAATNRDLSTSVDRGRFRLDLLARLHVLAITIPPLRVRPDDLEPIARSLLGRIGAARGRTYHLTAGAVSELSAYDWPGNVRELANVLKRAAIFARSERLDAEDVREAVSGSIFGHPEARAQTPSIPPPPPTPAEVGEVTLAEMERRHILTTFERLGSNVTRAAQALGIDRRTLQRKLRSFGREVGDD